jgi:hypothetical protein
MIEGIRFDFSGKELKEHFEKRAERHGQRAEAYAKEAARYKEGDEEPVRTPEMMYSNKAVQSAKQQLEGQAKHHKTRAGLFRVAAAHIDPDELYRLTESEMNGWEIVLES